MLLIKHFFIKTIHAFLCLVMISKSFASTSLTYDECVSLLKESKSDSLEYIYETHTDRDVSGKTHNKAYKKTFPLDGTIRVHFMCFGRLIVETFVIPDSTEKNIDFFKAGIGLENTHISLNYTTPLEINPNDFHSQCKEKRPFSGAADGTALLIEFFTTPYQSYIYVNPPPDLKMTPRLLKLQKVISAIAKKNGISSVPDCRVEW